MKEIDLSYSQFIALVISKGLSIQYTQSDTFYELFAVEMLICWNTRIQLGSDEAVDFETNYKTSANQPVNTKLAPFAASTVQFTGDSPTYTTIAPGTTVTIDYHIDPKIFPAGIYLTGGELITQNSILGDYVSAQVLDIDGVLNAGLNIIVANYIRKFYVQVPLNTTATITMELETSYAALIPAGLYLRLTYTSTGTNPVGAAINYLMQVPVSASQAVNIAPLPGLTNSIISI